MKRCMPPLLAAACILLLVCSAQALSSAHEALSLWWNSVLPALFPFYVLTSMLFRFGAFDRLAHTFRSPLLPCLLMGSVSGTPTGARVAVLLGCERYAACCNLMSPMFLLGVVAIGLCGDRSVFPVLAIAHYGGALPLLFAARFLTDDGPDVACAVPDATERRGGAMREIGEGMRAMLTVGGCIVFFYTIADTAVSALLGSRAPMLSALIIGLTEVTAGASRVASLMLPARIRLSILAFLTSFGGVCIFAQSMLVANLRRPVRYLLFKLAHGCLSGLVAYAAAPLFPASAVSVWSDASELYAQNALMGLTFVVAMVLGLLFSYVAALLIQKARASYPGSRCRSG